jgi:hypothetical protein
LRSERERRNEIAVRHSKCRLRRKGETRICKAECNLSFTVAGIVFALLAISGVAILPVHLNLIGLANFTHLLVRIARWPAMLVALGMALAVIYR